jgi:glycosyltransferase involved in cell wall biosynthesis
MQTDLSPVSIVIPMYNAQRHMEKVLGAIFDQDYSGPMEVIVVNDGSTDGSLDVIRELRKKWDFKIIDQSNQGAVRATNNGFKAASHDIIC